MQQNTKVVLITGCSSGIGKALAVEFASKENMFVYATSLSIESMKDLERKNHVLCNQLGENIKIMEIDVTSSDSISKAITLDVFVIFEGDRRNH